MSRRAAIAVAVCALLARAPLARGEETSLVTIIRPAHADGMVNEATMRLVAELHAAGFQVRVVAATAGSDGDGRGQVESRDPAAAGAFATIAILETGRGAVADVWVADHVTQKTLVRRVDVSDPTVANAASDLAVRSVELLRASLLEVSPQRSDLPPDLARWLTRPELVPTPPPVDPARRAETHVRTASPPEPPTAALPSAPPAPEKAGRLDRSTVEMNVGALFATGGFGVAFGPTVRVGSSIGGGYSLRATVAPSVTSTHLTAAHGTVSLSEQSATLDLVFTFRNLPIAPRFALGGGFYHVGVRGRASVPYVGEDHDAFAGFVAAGGGVQVRLHPGVAGVAELSALLATPNPTVTIAGTEAGSLGHVAVLGSLGLEMGF